LLTVLLVALIMPTAKGETAYYCFGQRATIVGTPGNDIYPYEGRDLQGTNGPDVIVGLGGIDLIGGEGGNDLICGGAGNDSDDYDFEGLAGLHGEEGDDRVSGGPGNDKVSGYSGKDELSGGRGHDKISDGILYREYGSADLGGGDRLYGGAGSDFLHTTAGNDRAEGGPGDDFFNTVDEFFAECDTCPVGDPGQDEYIGGDGDDTIEGWDLVEGNDLMHGDFDVDSCTADQGDQVRGCESVSRL
jgi:Ca2+-binding RTX toxin-like protein